MKISPGNAAPVSPAPHATPPQSVINGAFIMCFASGLLDTATLLSYTAIGTTHMSGASLKIGIYSARGSMLTLTPNFFLVSAFFVGAITSGVLTATPSRKTPKTCAFVIISVGVLCCLVGLMMIYELYEAVFLAAYTSGLQNGLITTFTGFMRTTHHTGTITDMGLLIGQFYPLKLHDKAHLWKTKVLSSLLAVWVAAGVFGCLIFDEIGVHLTFVPGVIGIIVGLYALVVIDIEARQIAADKAAEDAASAAMVVAKEAAAKGTLKLRKLTKAKVARMQQGLDALHEIAATMDGNLDSMTAPQDKVQTKNAFIKAYNTNKAKNLFLKKLSSRKSDGADVSSLELHKSNEKLGKICKFIMDHPDVLQKLEDENQESFDGFISSFCLQQDVENQEQKEKVQSREESATSNVTNGLISDQRTSASQIVVASEVSVSIVPDTIVVEITEADKTEVSGSGSTTRESVIIGAENESKKKRRAASLLFADHESSSGEIPLFNSSSRGSSFYEK